jgi:murein DD-endopeptidase MepM/ murein hydrolase activator NlpD
MSRPFPFPNGKFTQPNSARPQLGVETVRSTRQLDTFSVSLPRNHVFAIGGLLSIFLIAVLITGSYLMLRDDMMGATLANHARMQQAYEDRITNLRAQVDLVTSRQMLDQQAVEQRVSELLARQNKIGERQLHVRKALKRTGKLKQIDTITTSSVKRDQRASLNLGALVGSSNPFSPRSANPVALASADFQSDPKVLDSLEATLVETETAQLAELTLLRTNAQEKARKLARILTKQGIRVPNASAIGGPLIELKSAAHFSDHVEALDASLKTLDQVRRAAKSLPHGNPAPGSKISSRYGRRHDPFTGRSAMHAGLDFKARTGSKVIATASGKIIRAGRNGGYGKMVEIDHGGGITTRYAHLSRIKVRVGQKVSRGQLVGKVGSTGRSTGPHLHYEVRRKGRVLNPIHYVRLEKHLKPYL